MKFKKLKYTINKISNKNEIDDIYLKFIKFSPQRNVFCSKEILTFFFEDLDLYTVCKNEEIKSFVYLLRDKKGSVISDPFIYSGIINHPRLLMKETRYNAEVFKINELIVKEIFSNYKSLNINLPIDFIDTRPFLWFNYGEKDKKNFQVVPRYTSIINLKSRDKTDIYNEIDDVKRRDIKKVLLNKNYKISYQIDLDLIKKFYENTMKKNNGIFDKNELNKIFNFFDLQSKINKIIQSTVYFNEKPLYSVLFLNDDISSCYLYGSGDVSIKDRYAGTLALWKAIEKSIIDKLSFIDLEGINSPFRGQYKLSFGGNVKSYFNIIS